MKNLIIVFLTCISVLFSCSQVSNNESTSKNLEKLDPIISQAISDSTELFRFDFKILNMDSQKSADSIAEALEKLDAVIAFKTSYTNSNCIVYADSFEVIDVLSSTFLDLGFKFDKMLGVSGPGLSCGIEAEESLTSENSIEINSLEESTASFKNLFNQHKDKIRIVSIPNPSCLACVKGQRYINNIFSNEFPSDTNIVGFTAWISINGWGSIEDAERLAPEIQDDRVLQFWDPNMDLGILFKSPLKIDEDYTTAWDVYMIYDAGIIWDGEFPPAPTFWMHQIGNKESGVSKKLFLDKKIFTANLDSIINNQNSYL